jgi:hypothetical protein
MIYEGGMGLCLEQSLRLLPLIILSPSSTKGELNLRNKGVCETFTTDQERTERYFVFGNTLT